MFRLEEFCPKIACFLALIEKKSPHVRRAFLVMWEETSNKKSVCTLLRVPSSDYGAQSMDMVAEEAGDTVLFDQSLSKQML